MPTSANGMLCGGNTMIMYVMYDMGRTSFLCTTNSIGPTPLNWYQFWLSIFMIGDDFDLLASRLGVHYS